MILFYLLTFSNFSSKGQTLLAIVLRYKLGENKNLTWDRDGKIKNQKQKPQDRASRHGRAERSSMQPSPEICVQGPEGQSMQESTVPRNDSNQSSQTNIHTVLLYHRP